MAAEHCTVCHGRGTRTRAHDGQVIDCGHCLGTGWRWVATAVDVGTAAAFLAAIVFFLAVARSTS